MFWAPTSTSVPLARSVVPFKPLVCTASRTASVFHTLSCAGPLTRAQLLVAQEPHTYSLEGRARGAGPERAGELERSTYTELMFL